MSWQNVYSVRPPGCMHPQNMWSGVRTLCIAILLSCLSANPAQADCPAAPLETATDLVVSFLTAGTTQAGPATLFASTVEKGMLVYDGNANALKFCDGTNWLTLADTGGAGANAAGPAGYVQISDGSGGLTYSGSTAGQEFFWDNTNKRLGIGTATPNAPLHIETTGAIGIRTFVTDNHTSAGWTVALSVSNKDATAGNRAAIVNRDSTNATNAGIEFLNVDHTGASGSGSVLVLTRNAGTYAERLRIDHTGAVVIGNAGNNATATALLDLVSTTKGFLPPRMTTAQRNAIASAAAGLMIFNTDTAQMEFWNGSSWQGIGSMTTGTIAAFAASGCPTGWTEYTPARGRFLRGIDPTGTNDSVRAAGNTQDDAFQDHDHTPEIYSGTPIAGGNWQFATGAVTTANSANYDPYPADSAIKRASYNGPGGAGFNRGYRTATETRPKNVAVIFCQYSGSGGGGGGGSTTLAGLTDVDLSALADGKVLTYDNGAGKWVAADAGASAEAAGDGGQIQFNDGSDAFAADANLHWDNTNKRLGIGTASPIGPLQAMSSGQTSITNSAYNVIENYSLGALTTAASKTYTTLHIQGPNGSSLAMWGSGNPTASTAIKFNSGQRSTTDENVATLAKIVGFPNSTAADSGGYLTFATRPDGDTTATTPERMRIDSDGNVGIGTSNPSLPFSSKGLHVYSGAGTHGTIMIDAPAGSSAMFAMGKAGSPVWHFERIHTDDSFGIVETGVATRLSVLPGGNVGIGLAAPGYRLDLPNTASTAGRGRANSWTTYSDGRFKTGVESIDSALDKVTALKGVTYTSTTEVNGARQVGFIAQEVEKVVPEVVSVSKTTVTMPDGRTEIVDDYRSLAYDRLVPVLTEAIKELKAANDNQNYDIIELRREVEALKAAIGN